MRIQAILTPHATGFQLLIVEQILQRALHMLTLRSTIKRGGNMGWATRSSSIAVLLVTTACSQTEPIIGVLEPLSGSAAVYGQSVDAGMQVALAEAELAAALPDGFGLFTVDTGSDPATAATKRNRRRGRSQSGSGGRRK